MDKHAFLTEYHLTEEDLHAANITWDELIRIEEAYGKLEQTLREIGKSFIDEYLYDIEKAGIHSYRYRTKDIWHLLEKVVRKKKENPEKKAYNRFGVSVTKRVGGAVQRSRAKRILRAGYRAIEPELKTGYLVVVAPKDGILDIKSTDVERDLRRGFAKLDMFLENTTS